MSLKHYLQEGVVAVIWSCIGEPVVLVTLECFESSRQALAQAPCVPWRNLFNRDAQAELIR